MVKMSVFRVFRKLPSLSSHHFIKIRLFSSVTNNSDHVKIVEVGPRDGLQNEKTFVETDVKIELINRLSGTGLSSIEATSFVSPKWIPQFSDNKEVIRKIQRKDGVSYPVLLPNMKGYENAMQYDVEEIAIFASASEGFSMKNINCSIEESLLRFQDVCQAGKKDNIRIRGYVSCVIACPYDGKVQPKSVVKVAEKLLEMGCYEVSLGDTIGVGTPDTIEDMLRAVLFDVPVQNLALHSHDTNGKSVDNICKALDLGVRVVDTSVGGLGGCPYAKTATGNVATEKVLLFLHNLGVTTGVNEEKIMEIGNWIKKYLRKDT